jgi:hypothetical protein
MVPRDQFKGWNYYKICMDILTFNSERNYHEFDNRILITNPYFIHNIMKKLNTLLTSILVVIATVTVATTIASI